MRACNRPVWACTVLKKELGLLVGYCSRACLYIHLHTKGHDEVPITLRLLRLQGACESDVSSSACKSNTSATRLQHHKFF